MEQIDFQKSLIAALDRWRGEFGARMAVGEVLTFMIVATHPDITQDELTSRFGIRRRDAARYLRTLSAPEHWWQRRHGLIRTYAAPASPRELRCTLTLKGALVARTLFLASRRETLCQHPPGGQQ